MPYKCIYIFLTMCQFIISYYRQLLYSQTGCLRKTCAGREFGIAVVCWFSADGSRPDFIEQRL